MKKKNELIKKDEEKSPLPAGRQVKILDESALFERIAAIIDNRKSRAGTYVNSEITMMYWEIGNFINSVILGGERGKYGKQILATVSAKLTAKYGKGFELKNLRRMIQFAKRFPESEIVVPLARQLSWSHIIALLPIESDDAINRFQCLQHRRNLIFSTNQRMMLMNREMFPPACLPHCLPTGRTGRCIRRNQHGNETIN
jgi:hypothetical protein